MAVQGGEDVYATLLLNDTYLPGALVLARSLRDAGTTKRLAVLYTPDTVSIEVIAELKALYDYGIPVDRIRNSQPANLLLMNRPDLHSAFTKVNLWKLTQFRKIVYLDADVLALRAPDELFDLPHAFSAAPDIGWPDLFNTGVMALTPNMGDYYALTTMASRGVSFDGADQGLLNMYFKNDFNRLSFSYNVTPSAHYQYLPAYRHFQSSINMVHFIGPNKPWFSGRDADMGGSPYSDMVGRWWAVYDKHYRVFSTPQTPIATPSPTYQSSHTILQQDARKSPGISGELLRYFVKGEFNPTGEHRQENQQPHHVPSSSIAQPPPHRSQEPQEPSDYHSEHPPVDERPLDQSWHQDWQQQQYSQENPQEYLQDQLQGQPREHSTPQQGLQAAFHRPPPPPPDSHGHGDYTTLPDGHHRHPESAGQRSGSPQGIDGWQPHSPPPTQHAQSSEEPLQEVRSWHAPIDEGQPEHGWAPLPAGIHHHTPPYHHDAPQREAPRVHQICPSDLYALPLVPGPLDSSERAKAEAREEQVSAQHHPPEPETKRREPTPYNPIQTWDAQLQPPPVDSKPEAENFPQVRYEMSQDIRPFVPPERYPSPPQNMWYNVSREPPAPASEKPRAIFPWEAHKPSVSRVFWDNDLSDSQEGDPSTGELPGSGSHLAEPSMTGSTIVEARSGPATPSTVTAGTRQTDMWSSFDRANVWDENPQIQHYARKLEEKTQPRRSHLRLRAETGQSASDELHGRHGGLITDFPSASERPSLPVTPAPMRSHPKSWGSGGPNDGGELPAAAGVPSQVDWDPIAQLQKLAKQQSEVLMQRFGEEKDNGQIRPGESPGEQSVIVLSPQPVKGAVAANRVRDMIDRSERDGPAIRPILRGDAERAVSFQQGIPAPSYLGPGSAWERGECVPISLSPMPPTEEERDVLQT